MVGEGNSLIQQHMSQIEDVFGSGKEKSIEFLEMMSLKFDWLQPLANNFVISTWPKLK